MTDNQNLRMDNSSSIFPFFWTGMDGVNTMPRNECDEEQKRGQREISWGPQMGSSPHPD